MSLQYHYFRFDQENDGAGALIPYKIKIKDFGGTIRVVEFGIGDNPSIDPTTYQAQDGEPFRIEVEQQDAAGGFPLVLDDDPDSPNGYLLPDVRDVSDQTLILTMYPKNRGFVKLLTFNQCDFQVL